VVEGGRLVKYGNKQVGEDKNTRCEKHIERLLARIAPDALVLADVKAKGTHRAQRIMKLHQAVLKLAKRMKVKTVKISGTAMRLRLLGDEKGTRHAMAKRMAEVFPSELASRLPAERKPWQSDHPRLDLFLAFGLAIASHT